GRPGTTSCDARSAASPCTLRSVGTTMTLACLRPHHPLARGAAALILTILLHGCDGAGAGAAAAQDDPVDLGLLQEVARKVEHDSVAPVRGDELTAGALRGMLTRLDPHSDYLDQDQYQQMNAVTRGQFGGIGIELTLEGRVPEVIAPIEGTPAATAGIEPGDRIVRIDGQATTGMDVQTLANRLPPPPPTSLPFSIPPTHR